MMPPQKKGRHEKQYKLAKWATIVSSHGRLYLAERTCINRVYITTVECPYFTR